MTRSLERQAELFKTIASELVAIVSPAAWDAVEMIVRVAWHPDSAEVELELTSPDGHPDDEIAITGELEAAVEALLAELEVGGDRLVALRAVSRLAPDGTWELDSTLDYAPPPSQPGALGHSPAS